MQSCPLGGERSAMAPVDTGIMACYPASIDLPNASCTAYHGLYEAAEDDVTYITQ